MPGWRANLASVAALTVLVLFVAWPVVEALRAGLGPAVSGAGGSLAALPDGRAVLVSLAVAALVGAAASVAAGGLAWGARRTRAPWARVLVPLATAAAAAPPWLPALGLALAWWHWAAPALGPLSPVRAVLLVGLCQGLGYLPRALTRARAVLAAVPHELEQAAESQGAGLALTLGRVTIPLARRGLAGIALEGAALSLGDLVSPMLLLYPTPVLLTAAGEALVSREPLLLQAVVWDIAEVSVRARGAAAVVLLGALAAVSYGLARRALAPSPGDASTREDGTTGLPRALDGALGVFAVGAVGLYLVTSLLWPLGRLVALTLGVPLTAAAAVAAPILGRSIALSACAAALATALGLAGALTGGPRGRRADGLRGHRADAWSPLGRAVCGLLALGGVLPGIVYGLGWSSLGRAGEGPVSSGLWVVVGCLVSAALGAAMSAPGRHAPGTAVSSTPSRAGLESARSLGAGWWLTARTVCLPLAAPGLVAAVVAAFVEALWAASALGLLATGDAGARLGADYLLKGPDVHGGEAAWLLVGLGLVGVSAGVRVFEAWAIRLRARGPRGPADPTMGKPAPGNGDITPAGSVGAGRPPGRQLGDVAGRRRRRGRRHA